MRASWATGTIRLRGDTLVGVPRMVLSPQRRPTRGFTPNIRVALHLSYFQALVAPTAHGQGTLELQCFRVKTPCGPGSGWWVSGKQTLTVQRVLFSFHNLPSSRCLRLFIQKAIGTGTADLPFTLLWPGSKSALSRVFLWLPEPWLKQPSFP